MCQSSFLCPQVIQHGACLGLGVAALGTGDEEAFEDIKNVLYMDNAGGAVAHAVAFAYVDAVAMLLTPLGLLLLW